MKILQSTVFVSCLLGLGLLFAVTDLQAQKCNADFFYSADLKLVSLPQAVYKSDKDLASLRANDQLDLYTPLCQLVYQLKYEKGNLVEFIKFSNPVNNRKSASIPVYSADVIEMQVVEEVAVPVQEEHFGINAYMEDKLDAAVSFDNEKLIRSLPAERAAKEGKAYRTDPVQLKLFISQQGKVQGIVFDESITTLEEEAKKQLIVVLRPALAKTKWTAAEKSGRKVNGIVTLNFLMRWQYAVDQFNQKLVAADDILKIELIERYEIFEIVEDEAKPVGGMEGFYKHLEDNIQYPEKARKLGVGGVAYVRFIIDAAGDVESAQVVEGRELGYGLDEEAVRLIMLSKWEPGKQRGRAVRQRKLLPVRFKIPR